MSAYYVRGAHTDIYRVYVHTFVWVSEVRPYTVCVCT